MLSHSLCLVRIESDWDNNTIRKGDVVCEVVLRLMPVFVITEIDYKARL